jgi:hypothetical protein
MNTELQFTVKARSGAAIITKTFQKVEILKISVIR